MAIPKSRAELVQLVAESFAKLEADLDAAGPKAGAWPCVDAWSVRDVLAVRAWWTEHVVDWIEAGRRDERPVTPAPGYRWSETPRLNDDIVRAASDEAYADVRARLRRGQASVVRTIDALDDRELLEVGAFAWAGKWPIARWISINTARQYATARTYVRRAARAAAARAR